jgi:hypothetical protein
VDRREHRLDRLRLAVGAQDRRLRLTVGAQDRDWRSPSAVRICEALKPSAVRIAARLSRSARICFSIESRIDAGGSIALSSTRLTRMPQRPVASSSTPRSVALIWSREVRASSRFRLPTTLRKVVTVSCSTAGCSWRSRTSPPSHR